MFLLRCKSTPSDCTDRGQIVPANPDVAGIGVLISFLTMSSLAVIFGAIVVILEYCCDRSERKHPQSSSTGKILRRPSYWLNVSKQILLGLSDTQLLTGIGIQLVVLFLHCSIVIYHYWIAINLAYLSTITHLLTVVALKSHFIKHWLSSIPRLVLIVFNIGLFCYAAFILDGLNYATLNHPSNLTQLLACYYQGNRPSLKNSSFAGHWFTIIAIVIVIHAIVLWHLYKGTGKEHKARNMCRRCLSRLPILLVVIYIIFGLALTVPVLTYTEAMGSPKKVNITIDDTPASEKEWGFGQILPVLLLALPVFGGWETAVDIYDEEKEKKEAEISRTMSETILQQVSEHDLKQNWPGQGDRFDDFRVPSSRDITPHGSTQQV